MNFTAHLVVSNHPERHLYSGVYPAKQAPPENALNLVEKGMHIRLLRRIRRHGIVTGPKAEKG